MKPDKYKVTLRLLVLGILLLGLLSCRQGPSDNPITPESTAQSTENSSGLSTNAITTLKSLEKLDDYPFYVMVYTGGYEYPQISSTHLDSADFGCSLFAALGEAGDKIYGRNFDWDFSPSMLVFTDPPDGYASASMVDLTFLGISSADSQILTDLPLESRTALLDAPSLPFDGMNEYGLTVGMAAVPNEYADDTGFDPSKSTIGSIGIIRQLLDHARDVDEALEIFSQYNVRFGGGPPIHYLLADPTGKAVLVEFYRGELIQLPNENPWHLATNHMRCIANGDGGCWRYHTINDRLTALNGQLDAGMAMQILSEVKQDSTQWSSVYNLTSGEIQVVIARDYKTSYEFQLEPFQP